MKIANKRQEALELVLCNVFTPTRNALNLLMYRRNNEHTNTWKSTRIHTWR